MSELGSRYSSDPESPGLALWRVTNRWQAVIRRALAPFEITHVQFVLLAALTWSPADDGVTQAELAQQTRADPMMVSQVLRALETKGLVTRSRDAVDGRAIRVTATTSGQRTARTAITAVEDADASFFGNGSARPLPLLDHLLRLDHQD